MLTNHIRESLALHRHSSGTRRIYDVLENKGGNYVDYLLHDVHVIIHYGDCVPLVPMKQNRNSSKEIVQSSHA